jgi:predicted RNA-binding protein YlxR (DUF448 family)/ribosomal protein L30E
LKPREDPIIGSGLTQAPGEDVLVEAEGAVRRRRCVATRTSRPAETLIRFVVGPDAALVADLAGRLPGRGMWVGADRTVLSRAIARNQFAKAARAPVSASPDLVDQVGSLLSRRCLDLVGLARRAGGMVVGFEQVADWLRHGRCARVLTARDGSADGRRRIEALAGDVPVMDPFTRQELGSAVGRDEVVHVGLAKSGLARQLREELGRLHGFRDFRMPAGHAFRNAEDKGTARL